MQYTTNALKHITFLSCTILVLWGCSDSSNNATNNIDTTDYSTVNNNTIPNSYEELIANVSCDSNTVGAVVYIASENATYACTFVQSAIIYDPHPYYWTNQQPNNKLADLPLIIGTMIDSRDGKTYRTTTIGTQTWMAENLNYEPEGICNSQWHKYGKDYDCKKYGRFYSWTTALNCKDNDCSKAYPHEFTTIVQGICPEGWHIPSIDEWNTLVLTLRGGDPFNWGDISSALKSSSNWMTQNGSDTYGFSAFPGGTFVCYNKVYGYCDDSCNRQWEQSGTIARFWLTNNSYDTAFFIEIGDGVSYTTSTCKNNYNNVRCVKD